MRPTGTIVFLGDGMADEPLRELDGLTPLQYARTPGMDSIARDGVSGTLLTLPDGYPTSSEVANMSVLGSDVPTEFCGRGPLEAAGQGIRLGPDDKAFRLNLVSQSDGVLTDYSGGRPSASDAAEIVAELNRHFGSDTVTFHPGVSYRTILVLHGPAFSHLVSAQKPDDNKGQRIADHLPEAVVPEAAETARFLIRLVREAPAVLENSDVNRRLAASGKAPVNGVWPWNGGRAGSFRSLREKYGISSAVISAVDVIVGLGRCLGMDVIHVDGATGYLDTNYEGKAAAAIAALKDHDFVYLHLEAIDEVSHEQDLGKKLQAIQDFDARIVVPVLDAIGPAVTAAVLPDHPVPIATGKHTRTPVPVSVRARDRQPDAVRTFDEVACRAGALGAMKNGDLMAALFPRPAL